MKTRKNWLFSAKKKPTSTICASNIKSPDYQILTPELINKLIFLFKFLEKDESKFNNITKVYILFIKFFQQI